MTAKTETIPRRQRKERRAEEILDAAFAEFSRSGYAATKLDDIANRVGVTKGTIYVYFDSKEHLFISMMRQMLKPALEDIQGLLQSPSDSASSLLLKYLRFTYRRIVEDDRGREVARMLIAESGRFPELADRWHEEIMRPIHDAFGKIIKKGMDSGEFRSSTIRDFPQVVFAPAALLHMWTLLFGNRRQLDLDRYLDAHIELIMNGLLA